MSMNMTNTVIVHVEEEKFAGKATHDNMVKLKTAVIFGMDPGNAAQMYISGFLEAAQEFMRVHPIDCDCEERRYIQDVLIAIKHIKELSEQRLFEEIKQNNGDSNNS